MSDFNSRLSSSLPVLACFQKKMKAINKVVGVTRSCASLHGFTSRFDEGRSPAIVPGAFSSRQYVPVGIRLLLSQFFKVQGHQQTLDAAEASVHVVHFFPDG